MAAASAYSAYQANRAGKGNKFRPFHYDTQPIKDDLYKYHRSAGRELDQGFGQTRRTLNEQYNTLGEQRDAAMLPFQGYMDRGNEAGISLRDYLLGNKQFDASTLPGYSYQFDEGQRALNNSAIGNSLSGQQGMALQGFGQNLANQYYQQHLDNLAGMAGRGLDATSGQANIGAHYAGLQDNNRNGLASAYWNLGTGQAQLDSALGSSLGDLGIADLTAKANAHAGMQTAMSNQNAAQAGMWGQLAGAFGQGAMSSWSNRGGSNNHQMNYGRPSQT